MRAEDYARARELYHELSELSAEQRAAALAERETSDSVRALLHELFEREGARGADGDGRFARMGSALLAAAAAQGGGEAPPRTIGGYRVLRLLGEGGMGVVYEARHREAGTKVALKLLRHGPRARSEVARFLREAEVLKTLRHPGIAAFYEAGTAALDERGDELPYLAMELVEGRPLLEHAERAALDLRQRVELFAAACDAIEHAHRLGIVHRDLKPANILVAEEPEGPGRPKVLDFGVARAAALDLPTMTRTESGVLLGTLPYMSPEQVSGDSKRIDARSDVYSLGVLLYELFSGQLPYDVRERPLPDAARVISEVEPRRLGSVAGRLRGDLEWIAAKSLEKEPERRYASAGELADDLRRHLAGRALVARPPSVLDQARRFARRHRTLVATAAGTVAALFLGLLATAVFALRESVARRHADANAYRGRIAAATAAVERGDVAAARLQLDAAPEELRGWEWLHLESRLDDSLARWSGSLEPYRQQFSMALDDDEDCLRFVPSPDAGGARRLRSWRWRTGALAARELDLPLGEALLDPSGAWLLVGEERSVRIERAADGELRERIPSADRRPGGIAASLRAELVAFRAGSEAWLAERGRAPRRLDAALDGGAPLWLDPRGSTVASLDRAALVLASTTPEAEPRRVPSPRPGLPVQPSPDGTRAVLTDGAAGSVLVLDATPDGGARLVGAFHGRADWVNALAVSPDSTLVATGGRDCTLDLWSLADGSPSRRLAGHGVTVHDLCFSADGARIASYADFAGTSELCIWDAAPRDPRVLPHDALVTSVAFLAGGERILTGDGAGYLRVFDARSSVEVARLRWRPPSGLILSALGLPDGRRWVFAAREKRDELRKRVVVLDPLTGEVSMDELTPDLEDGGMRLSLAPDGGLLAAFEARTAVTVSSTRDGSVLARVPAGDVVPSAGPAWSPDGRLLAVFALEGGVELLDGRTLERSALISGERQVSRVLAFDPSGRILAVAGAVSGILLWDLAASPPRARVLGSAAYMCALAFAPDGRRLFAGGRDRTLEIWDPVGGEQVARLGAHRDDVIALAVSPDGGRVITGSRDRTVRIHDADTTAERVRAREEWEATAARVAPRVDAWLAAHGPHETERLVRAETTWNEREREIASQVLLRRCLAER